VTQKEYELIEMLKVPKKKLQAIMLLVEDLNMTQLEMLKSTVDTKMENLS